MSEQPEALSPDDVAAYLRALADRVQSGATGTGGNRLKLSRVSIRNERHLADPQHDEPGASVLGYQTEITVGWGEPRPGWEW
jgi:hypothetical protein